MATWNLAGRRCVAEQVGAILTVHPDIIALQEVRPNRVRQLQRALAAGGFPSFVYTTPEATSDRRKSRQLGVAVATKGNRVAPLQGMTLPWREKGISTGVELSGIAVDVHSVHVPPGASNGWVKIEHFEAIHRELATRSSRARLLCGDLNSPRCELPNGTVVTWGHRLLADGSVRVIQRKGHGGRWAEAELSVLRGLEPFGFTDAFRSLHGYQREAASFWTRRKGRSWPRRFDHMFCSPELVPIEANYLEHVARDSLSDHAMLVARFRVR